MLVMTKRKPMKSYETRFPGRTLQEVVDRLDDALDRQAKERDVRFHGPRLTFESLVNAIVLHFLSLTAGEQDAIVDRFIREFEAKMALETETPAEDVAGGEGKPLNGGGRIRTIPGSPRPARKGRGRKAGG